MVPPDVTASRCAPGRPVSPPVSRSHTMRGRSSANSSLGYRPEIMSSTASRTGLVSVANGAALRTRASRSSTAHSSIASIATICWASTSSGLAGTRSDSIRPSRIRSTTTAVLHEVAAVLGEQHAARHRPDLVAPRGPPAAARWRTLGRVTRPGPRGRRAPCRCPAPGSTSPRRRAGGPAFSSPSISARCSLLTDPWWARASTAGAPADAPAWAITSAGRTAPESGRSAASGKPATSRSCQISLSRAVSRSASRRELAKTSVE
jgi:hypothetical protein